MDVKTEGRPTLESVQLKAYGPSEATLNIWWQETELFSLADHGLCHVAFQPLLELLRRPIFEGTSTLEAIKTWFWTQHRCRPVLEKYSPEEKDWLLHFELAAELHHCEKVVRRWSMQPVIQGTVRLSLNMDSSETDVDLMFVSNGLRGQSCCLSWESETWTLPLPVHPRLPHASEKELFRGVILRLKSNHTETQCPVM